MAARFFNCVGRLQQAAGRHLSDTEIQEIFERVHTAALAMKSGKIPPGQGVTTRQPAYGLAIDNVITQAAAEAARQYVADAALKEARAAAQVVKLAARLDDAQAMKNAGLNPLEAVSRLITMRADGRSNTFSLENLYYGVAADMKRQIQDTWLALGDDFLGFVQDADKIKLLLREMKGEDTGDAMAKTGAKAWLDMAEKFRTRFNDSGGNVGKLDDWALPQHHAQELVARAGQDAWVKAVMPALDRARYVDDAGQPWDDARVKEFLGKAWDTIASGGYSKLEPGKYQGTGAVANRGSQERQIHFKDADAYLNYWAEFGERTFPDILMGHVDSMARNIAQVEHFGPNPDQTFRTLRDMAAKESIAAALKNPDAKARANAEPAARQESAWLDVLWNTASGRTTAGRYDIASPSFTRFMGIVRDLNVAGKLGGAVWASVYGDKVAMETMSHLNNLPALQRWYDELRMLNPANADDRALLRKQGLMLEYMTSAMSRFGDEYGQSRWSGKLANGVMRVSGMNAINDLRRGAFGLSMYATLGEMASTMDFAKAKASDMHILKTFGVTDFDWKIWKTAHLENLGHGNDRVLTPDAIARITDDELRAANIIGQADGPAEAQKIRTQAITKLLGVVGSESRYAVIEPGFRERAQMARLTGDGPLARAFWQFKSFPLAQFERMWDTAMSRPSFGGKAGTIGMIMAMQTLAGAMILQTRDMLSGKDPRDMTDWKFWLAAFFQGGTLGLYGDFVYGFNQTRYGTGLLEAAAGPTIGAGLDLITSTLTAGRATMEGKESHLGPHFLQVAKGFIPGNNLWYTKAATDHLFFQNIQETLSPGYLGNMKARTAKEFGQEWWWSPGDSTPERAPDLGAAFGN